MLTPESLRPPFKGGCSATPHTPMGTLYYQYIFFPHFDTKVQRISDTKNRTLKGVEEREGKLGLLLTPEGLRPPFKGGGVILSMIFSPTLTQSQHKGTTTHNLTPPAQRQPRSIPPKGLEMILPQNTRWLSMQA